MMTRKSVWGLACLLAVLSFGFDARAEDGRFIVGLRDRAKGRAALAAAGARVALDLGPQRAVAALLPGHAVAALSRNPAIAYVEEDPRRYPLAQTIPYGIDLVQAPLVWSLAGGAARKVCVIDSGLALGHEDLQTWDVSGYPSNWSSDGCSHGTHVTGTLAALGNEIGVVGALPEGVSLYVVRVFGDDCRWAYASDLVDALNRCRSAGAHVVSMSLGGSFKSRTEDRAFAKAWDAGLLSVAAAGNAGSSQFSYPASYDSVISVAAVDSNKAVASFSQHNGQVELAAPGVAVLSTVASGGYEAWSGTSMATPHVSGVAALVWSADPSWTNVQLRSALRATAEDLGAAGRDDYYGYGLVQARAALDHLRGANAPPAASFGFTCDGSSCAFTDTSTDADGVIVAWSWDFAGLGGSTAQHPSFSFPSDGTWLVGLTVTDDGGGVDSVAEQVTVSAEAGSAIELTAVGYKVRGWQRVDLAWRNAAGGFVDLYRDGALVVTTENDSAYTDDVGARGAGSHEYRLCEQGSAVCSKTVFVVIK